MRKPNDGSEWVQVYTTSTELDAYFIKGNLESKGIEARILSQVDTTRQFTLGGLAIVKIYVREKNAETAKQIILDTEDSD